MNVDGSLGENSLGLLWSLPQVLKQNITRCWSLYVLGVGFNIGMQVRKFLTPQITWFIQQ